MEPLLTADELARELHCGVITIYRLARSGKLPGLRIFHVWRFERAEIERWIEQRTVNPHQGDR